MVKLSTFVLVALSSLTAAQNYDNWKKLCSGNDNKDYCQQWIEWVRGGQQGRQPQPPASATRPKTTSSKAVITPLPKSQQSQPSQPSQPPWQPQQVPSQPPPWQTTQSWSATQTWTNPEPIRETSKNLPPPTPAPQQGSVPPPYEQAICTVEIYSFTTRPEGQRTRTRTRTIIAPYISTITQLITTDTTSIQVETIVQEQKEQTITSSQTICN